MRRLACLLVAVGCVLLALTVVGVSRPDRAPARIVHSLGRAPEPAGLRQALNRLVQGMGGASGVIGHRPRRARTITVPPSLGTACAVGAGSCTMHPCLLYTDQARAVVRPQARSVVRPRASRCRRPRPAFASAHLVG